MVISKEVEKLRKAWERGDFQKHLERINITNIRGWTGQPILFNFPLCAVVGENGAGKTSILQAAAVCYRGSTKWDSFFASQFFPDTAWEQITNASISATAKEGQAVRNISVRKPTSQWRGNPERPKRPVHVIDLRRTSPIYAKPGYSQIARKKVKEQSHQEFDSDFIQRASEIIGKQYARGVYQIPTQIPTKRYQS